MLGEAKIALNWLLVEIYTIRGCWWGYRGIWGAPWRLPSSSQRTPEFGYVFRAHSLPCTWCPPELGKPEKKEGKKGE